MPLKGKKTKVQGASRKARKSPSDFPRREFKRPIPANRMTAGVSYEGWQCKNDDCRKVIAIMTTTSRGPKVILQEADDHIASMKCPHCGTNQEHRWNAREDLVHGSKP
jgi:hypothetical protein